MMSELRNTVATLFFFASVFLFLLYAIINLLHQLLWRPYTIQKSLNSQGISGPGYKFLLGNAIELIQMRKEALYKPMSSLSHDLVPRLLPDFHYWMNRYGKNFVFWAGPQAYLVVTDTEMVKQVLYDKGGKFPKSELPHGNNLNRILGHGIVTNQGERWSRVRKLASYSFHGDKLNNHMVPEIVDSVETMLGRWKSKVGEEIEVFEEFRLLTGEVISRSVFGSSFQDGREIFDMFYRLSTIVEGSIFKINIPIISKVFRSSEEKEADMLEEGIRDRTLEIVKFREEKVKSGEADGYGDDYLGLLIQSYHEQDESRKISAEDLIDECKTLYFAGQETTNVLLSWLVLLLANYQDWQEQARNEVIAVFGRDKSPDVNGITKLKTMGMIINETLRLYSPTAETLPRKVVEEGTKLGHLTLPAGVRLQIPIINQHHDPDIWGDDVLQFNPERFAEGFTKATNGNPSAFMPFGMGPRMCVGMGFAKKEAKIALSMILQRYSFSLSPGYVHCPRPFLTMSPDKGVQVILRAL